MYTYSMDLRKRVLAACDGGRGTLEVARSFNVSPAWVRRLKQRRREEGTIEPRPNGGDRRSKITPDGYEMLCQIVFRHPDLTLRQLVVLVKKELDIELSVASLCRTLQKIGLTFKKSP